MSSITLYLLVSLFVIVLLVCMKNIKIVSQEPFTIFPTTNIIKSYNQNMRKYRRNLDSFMTNMKQKYKEITRKFFT